MQMTRRGHCALWHDHPVRLADRRLIAIAALAAILVLAVAMGASASSPVKITNCNTAASRPKLLTLTCGDGNTVLKGLRWSTFGGNSAQASGTFVTNTCEPNCAAGKDVSYPVTAMASAPRNCGLGIRVYDRLTLTFTGRAPKSSASLKRWTLGCPYFPSLPSPTSVRG
jgi:hypothetical protein